MKKILLYGLCSLSLALGLSTVDAKTYTSYNTGDKITVSVNDTKQLNFYVIEDDSDSLTAIYESILGDSFYFSPTTDSISGSAAEMKLNELTRDWENPDEIRLIKFSEIMPNIDLTESVSEDFSTPSYYNIGYSYWTQDVIRSTGENYFPVLVTTWGSFSNIHDTQEEAPANYGAIRPVINVDKEYVVGGVTETEEDKIWNDFVESYKTSDLIKFFEDNAINISSTDNTLKVEASDGTINYTTKFNYENGILTYVPSTNDEDKISDSIWVSNALSVLASMKNYDTDKLNDWLESQTNLTLDTDGIEFVERKVTVGASGASITSNVFDSFKLDIKNGLKTFKVESSNETVDNSNSTVQNPETGLFNGICVVGTVGLLSLGVYLILKKKNVFPKA